MCRPKGANGGRRSVGILRHERGGLKNEVGAAVVRCWVKVMPQMQQRHAALLIWGVRPFGKPMP